MVATKAFIAAAVSIGVDAMRKTNQADMMPPDHAACAASLGPLRFQKPFKLSKESLCDGEMTSDMQEIWREIIPSNFADVENCAEVAAYCKEVDNWELEEAANFLTGFLTNVRKEACATFDKEQMCQCNVQGKEHLEKCDATKGKGGEPFDYRCEDNGGKLTRVTLEKAEVSDEMCARSIGVQSKYIEGRKVNPCKIDSMSRDAIKFTTKIAKQGSWPNSVVGAHYKTSNSVSKSAALAIILDKDSPRNTKKVRFLDDGVEQTIPEEYIISTVPQMCAEFATDENFGEIGKCYENWDADGCAGIKDRVTTFMSYFKEEACKKK